MILVILFGLFHSCRGVRGKTKPYSLDLEVISELRNIFLYTVGTLNPDFDKNMLLLRNPQYLPDHYETLTQ